jgi:hypothetical protein
MQMPSVVELDQLEDLHAHVRLVHQASCERQVPEVPALRIAAGKEDIGYVEEPVAVLGVELGATPSVEDFCAEGCDLPPLVSVREKKAAWVYSLTTFTVRSSDSNTNEATSRLSILRLASASS